jgi:hypothetical protein
MIFAIPMIEHVAATAAVHQDRQSICEVRFTNPALPPQGEGFNVYQVSFGDENKESHLYLYVDECRQDVWLTLYTSGLSKPYLQFNTRIEKVESKEYFLNLNHMTQEVCGPYGGREAVIQVLINGHIVRDYTPNTGRFVEEQIDITPYIQNGENTVKISVRDHQGGGYFIKSLSIESF